ncbi:MAG: hypothetical protein KIS29_10975 [Thermoplasmata archaeon]|nr:hypothetical protein [Candidatus Sysuiplasma jiujiangense]
MRPISFLIGLFLLLFIGYELLTGNRIQEIMFLAVAGNFISAGYFKVSTTYTILFFVLLIFATFSLLYGLGSSDEK